MDVSIVSGAQQVKYTEMDSVLRRVAKRMRVMRLLNEPFSVLALSTVVKKNSYGDFIGSLMTWRALFRA